MDVMVGHSDGVRSRKYPADGDGRGRLHVQLLYPQLHPSFVELEAGSVRRVHVPRLVEGHAMPHPFGGHVQGLQGMRIGLDGTAEQKQGNCKVYGQQNNNSR